MKAVVPLLVTILIVGILNLLQGFGLFGGGGGGSADTDSYQYISYAAEDIPPFVTFLATLEYKDKADEEGNVTFPQAELFDIRRSLPRLLNHMSSEGWELVDIKEATGVHVFRRPLEGDLVDAPRPWEDGPAVDPPAGGAGATDGTEGEQPAAGAGATPAPASAPAAGATEGATTPASTPAAGGADN